MQDPRVRVVNGVPYLELATLGHGASSIVSKVELLVPLGSELLLRKRGPWKPATPKREKHGGRMQIRERGIEDAAPARSRHESRHPSGSTTGTTSGPSSSATSGFAAIPEASVPSDLSGGVVLPGGGEAVGGFLPREGRVGVTGTTVTPEGNVRQLLLMPGGWSTYFDLVGPSQLLRREEDPLRAVSAPAVGAGGGGPTIGGSSTTSRVVPTRAGLGSGSSSVENAFLPSSGWHQGDDQQAPRSGVTSSEFGADTEPIPILPYNVVRGEQLYELSGFRCAMKRVTATGNKQFKKFADEVRLLRSLADSKHVVEIYDAEYVWDGRRLWGLF